MTRKKKEPKKAAKKVVKPEPIDDRPVKTFKCIYGNEFKEKANGNTATCSCGNTAIRIG